MVFGIHSGRAAPLIDDDGHIVDPNSNAPYETGPDDREYILDPTHPEYDPGIDPNLQLRTVRTAAESIAESHRSEARREQRAKAKRKQSILNRLGRGKTLNRKATQRRGASEVVDLVQEELDRIRERYDADQSDAVRSSRDGAAAVPFESAQQDVTPTVPTADLEAAIEQQPKKDVQHSGGAIDLRKKKGKSKPAQRRNVYLNIAPSLSSEVNRKGEPTAKYPRNKVQTSKYTIITFLPKFLTEQFRRLANIYFLGLVLLQTSSLFGATVPQIAMLPLVAILGITAIKDGIEDYRRHVLDNQVNNSSVTRLGNWRNVNQPRDSRTLLEKIMGKSALPKISKGVKRLREKEDAIGLGPVGNSPNKEYKTEIYAQNTISRTESQSSAEQGQHLETIASLSERGTETSRPSYSRGASTNALVNPSHPSLGPTSRVSLQEGRGVVDYRRHTPGTARWERTLWKKLEVGDVILLRENDQVPADLVLLNSSDPDGNAFVETKNLDGETNLKVKKCVKATIGIQTEEDVEHARFVIDSEPPHANLYSYNALLKFEKANNISADADDSFNSNASTQEIEPITANELLLRGCAIRNTDWVIGLVVFTGKDTKIMLNGGDTPSKRSKIEKETNINVAVNFIILLIMCTACAIVGGIYLNSSDTSRDFYEVGSEYSSSNIINALIIFGSCLVLYQNIVPISLYISIELTKTISAFFIYQDIDMYFEPLDHPCVPKTWGIVDDLGQIEYVFSDKTGTLTQNVMEFKKCSINGISYGEGITEAMIGAMKRQGKDLSGMNAEEQQVKLESQKEQMIIKMNQTFKNRYLRTDQLTLISPDMANAIASQEKVDQRRNIVAFFRALAICHTALADRNANDPFLLEYKAQSPDEAALVSAARDVGAVFLNKNNSVVDIEVMGQPERYTPLKVLEFNSTRKRMSVIVRDNDGKLLMICKGADSVIYQRLRKDHPEGLKRTTQRDLEDFANAGLRTLCIAYRYLQEGEYLEWARLHDEAAASLTDRDDNIDEACEKIENNLTLMGATALEDKLQVGVPEAIEKLHQAGIKLWILTGDKLQTAIEIGFSCNLLSCDMEIMIISADHEQGARAQLEAACNKIAASGRPVVVRGKNRGIFRKRQKQTFDGNGISMDKSQFAVVVDGETLKFCLDQALKPLFLALTTQCETVVCCRVSPAQKALTVRLVKDGIGAMTVSIGDGANDVSMIQEAHVGVGIAGLEGAQASMSADYAIGQFRYLAKLLLVHGHWNTYRIGVLHQVFFYKNLIWTFSLLLFQVFCQANATYLFDYSLVLLYNLIFTSLPVIMLGSLDQDVRAPALMRFPQTYAPGREGKLYTRSQFWFACVDGIYQSVVCFMLPAASYYWFPIVNADGLSLDPLDALGSTVAASCVVAANLYCGLMLQNWSIIIWLVIILSNLSYFVWITIYSAPFFESTFGGTAYVLYGTVQFWAVLLLSVVVSLLPRYTWNAWNSSFQPTQIDLVRQAWVKGDLKNHMGLRQSASNEKLYESHLEEGGGNSRHHRNGSGRSDESYDDPRSHDPALRQSQRDGSASRSAMTRAHDSNYSFYDPDTLPNTSTLEPESSRYRSNDSGQRMLHSNEGNIEDDLDGEQRYKGNAMGLPRIHVQKASTSTSTYPYPKRRDEAATSRTALASTSTDSFEDSFTKAFGGENDDHDDNRREEPMQSASTSPTSTRNYHMNFHRHSTLPSQQMNGSNTSSSDPLQREMSDFDKFNDADESLVAPSHSQRNNLMDSSIDSIEDSNFQTPTGSPRRQRSDDV